MLLEADFDWRIPLVVLGAGRARRMGAMGARGSKVALPLDPGKRTRLLDVLAGAWAPWASELWLVVRRDDPEVRELLYAQPVPGRLIVQPEPRGTAAALAAMAEELPERFLVVLGDCLLDGRIEGPRAPFPGVAVWPGADPDSIRANYGVRMDGDRVLEVEEKPARTLSNWVCGLGVYFFDRTLLQTMQSLAPDARGNCELTDGLAKALVSGLELTAARLTGRYVNINTAADLERAAQWFRPSP